LPATHVLRRRADALADGGIADAVNGCGGFGEELDAAEEVGERDGFDADIAVRVRDRGGGVVVVDQLERETDRAVLTRVWRTSVEYDKTCIGNVFAREANAEVNPWQSCESS